MWECYFRCVLTKSERMGLMGMCGVGVHMFDCNAGLDEGAYVCGRLRTVYCSEEE